MFVQILMPKKFQVTCLTANGIILSLLRVAKKRFLYICLMEPTQYKSEFVYAT